VNKKIVVGVTVVSILISLILIFSSVLLATGDNATISNNNSEAVSINHFESGVLTSGNDKVGYSILDLNLTNINQGKVSMVWCKENPLSEVYVLNHPYIESDDRDLFVQDISTGLAKYNMFVSSISSSSLRSVTDSIIIIPTGRFPVDLIDQKDMLLQNNNVLIYIGKDNDYLLDSEGSIIANENFQSFSSNEGQTIKLGNFNIHDDQSGAFIYHLKPLNNINNYSALSTEITNMILYQTWEVNCKLKEYTLSNHIGKKLFATSITSDESGFIRIIYSANSDKYSINGMSDKFVNYTYTNTGKIIVNPTAYVGENLNANVKLTGQYSEPVLLELHLDYVYGKEIIQSTKLGEINIKSIWDEDYIVQNKLTPGDYILSLRDQYHVVWAQAYLHVNDLQIELIEMTDSKQIFKFKLDGGPISSSGIPVSIDGVNLGVKEINNKGELIVYSNLGRGNHNLQFEIKGRKLSYNFENGALTIFDYYVMYGIPILLLVFIIVFFSKGNNLRKYKLFIPDSHYRKVRKVIVKPITVTKIFDKVGVQFGWGKLPLSEKEFQYGAKLYLEDNKETVLTDGNVIEILDEMSRKGILDTYGGYYAPKEYSIKSNIEELVLKRIVRDYLISNGVTFVEQVASLMLTDKTKIYFNGVNASSINPSRRNIVIFHTSKDLNDYLIGLNSLDKKSSQLMILIKNKKLKLITFSNFKKVVW